MHSAVLGHFTQVGEIGAAYLNADVADSVTLRVATVASMGGAFVQDFELGSRKMLL